MKVAGIIVGIIGAVLFVWHAIKVVMGRDVDSAFMSHTVLSLVGGIMVLVAIWIYVVGRRRPRRR